MGLRTRPLRTDFWREWDLRECSLRENSWRLADCGMTDIRWYLCKPCSAGCGQRDDKSDDFLGPRDQRKRLTAPSLHREFMKRHVLGGGQVTRMSSEPRGRCEGVIRTGMCLTRLPEAGQRSVPGASASGHRGRVTQMVSEGIYERWSLFWPGSGWV